MVVGGKHHAREKMRRMSCFSWPNQMSLGTRRASSDDDSVVSDGAHCYMTVTEESTCLRSLNMIRVKVVQIQWYNRFMQKYFEAIAGHHLLKVRMCTEKVESIFKAKSSSRDTAWKFMN